MSVCTLGAGPFPPVEYPGPVLAYRFGDMLLPRWAPSLFPAEGLTPVREWAHFEAGEQTWTGAPGDILTALQDAVERARG